MVLTVAPIDVSFAAPAVQPAPAGRQDVEVASGPSRSPSAAEASQFGNLLKKDGGSSAELQARLSRPQPASRIGSAVDGAMKHLSAYEAQVRTVVFGADGPGAGQPASAPSGSAGTPAGAAQSPPGGATGTDFIRQMSEISQQEGRSTMLVVQFELQTMLYGKAAEKSLGAVNQLLQEK